ncbi:MAG: hypothetical protein ACRDGM_19125 [bacterium]
MKQQHHYVVLFFAAFLANVSPRTDDRDYAQQGRQHHQHQRKPIDAELIAGPDQRDPLVVFDELQSAVSAVIARSAPPKSGHEWDRDQETQPDPHIREPANAVVAIAVEEQDEDRANRREPRHPRQQADLEYLDMTRHSQSLLRMSDKLQFVAVFECGVS